MLESCPCHQVNVFFWSGIRLDCSELGYTTRDWCVLGGTSVFSLAPGGRILWRSPKVLLWKEVKGLEQLQHSLTHQLPTMGDITKLCISPAFNLLIFWNVKDTTETDVELWSAEISVEGRKADVWGTVLWSHAVLKVKPISRSGSVDVLFADSVLG
ncbi:Galactose oxidase/kelch repeat superfamily protein [Raphanus sativus]|nr:Galactose oxidase/kelch repeat superfamily protein [Raphanus sativus]